MAAKRKQSDSTSVEPQQEAEVVEVPVLRFVGGEHFLGGVPARDLAIADINELATFWEKDPGVVQSELLASSLYALYEDTGELPEEDGDGRSGE